MTRIEARLARARAELDRVGPGHAHRLHRDGALLVDIRPHANRIDEGQIAGAIVLERIVLEWRLDPTSPDRLHGLGADDTVIIMCNEGYASSLAAQEARGLGLRGATDLIGGFRGWAAAGLPTIRASCQGP